MDTYSWTPGLGSPTQLPLYPAYTETTLQQMQDYTVVRTISGVVEKRYRHGRSMPQFLSFPIADRAGWEGIKQRLDPRVPERYAEPRGLAADTNARRNVPENREILPLPVCGAYGFPRALFGAERLAYLLYDDSQLVHEVLDSWFEFYLEYSTVISGIYDLDYVFLWEDMAFKNGPLISPAMVREFIEPRYRQLIGHLRQLGYRLFHFDTDGDPRLILDPFAAAGVNFLGPCEIAAGAEPAEIRARYGRRLSLAGGVDKRALAKGQSAIYEEVMRKVPHLLRDGGYAPGVDHAVPNDISFEDYGYFVELVRQLSRDIEPDPNRITERCC